jgi:Zn-dependent protease with chaperone function
VVQGRLYDGVTGHPHEVSVAFGAGEIELSQAGGWAERIEAAQLRRLEPVPGSLRVGYKDRPGWRLLLPPECADEMKSLLGKEERYGRWIDRVGLVPALIVGGLITASVVAIGYVAPHWIAPHVPMSWERNVGSAIVGDFGNLRCRDAKGQHALEALVERVSPGATKGPDGIKVAALDVSMFNAAALPGGYVVVFKPAITETNPDALAGILAHEVAHVHRRHVAEALIREFGIGALVRMMGGNIGANAEQIISLSYTRQNEAQADADAIRMLRQAGISPRPTAAVFAGLAKGGDQQLASRAVFLQSHPLSKGRAERFAASFDPRAQYRPALSPEQWSALTHICPAAPKFRN